MTQKLRYTLFSCFVWATAMQAQQPIMEQVKLIDGGYTLEQCIDYALKNNIQIKQSELNNDLAKTNLVQSEANLLPSLNASGAHSYNIGRTIDRFTNQFANAQVLSQNFGLSSDVTLFSGWQNINTIQQNRYNLLASKFDVEKMRNDISLNIATAYLQVLFAMEAADNARSQLATTNLQVARSEKLFEAGSIAKGGLLDIQAQYATEQLNYTNAENQLNIAYLSLAQLLNITTIENFTIVKPIITISNQAALDVNATQVYSTASTNLPEVKSAEFKLKSAEKGLQIAKGGISPRLTFSASYGTGYSGLSQRLVSLPSFQGYAPNGDVTSGGDTVYSPQFSNAVTEKTPFVDQYQNNVNKSFGFFLTVPLFNRLQTKTAIDKARIQRMSAELTVESTKQQINKNIQQAFADVNAGLKKYNSTQKALDAMTEAFNYTKAKFDNGLVGASEFNDLKNKLIKTQSDLLQAKYEYVFKTKVLEFYQGKPLRL
jgi:outer membrane protein